jgi:hypothetical protein
MSKAHKKPDMRHGMHGTVKTDTEAHVVGAETKKQVPESDFKLVTPDVGNIPEGQTTKG